MNLGEATAALLAVQLASLEGYSSLMLERDSLTSILAINNAKCFTEWNFSSVIVDTHYLLHFMPKQTASNISRKANYRARHTAKWTVSNLIFGSIPNSSLFSFLLGSTVRKIHSFSFFFPFPSMYLFKKKNQNISS